MGVSFLNLVAIGTSDFQQNNQSHRLTYTHDFLTHCNSLVVLIPLDGIPPEIRRDQVGVSHPDQLATAGRSKQCYTEPEAVSSRQRYERGCEVRGQGPQFLRNKVDELQVNVKHISVHRNACVIALTETWLEDYDLNQDLDINGFHQQHRFDRDAQITGKSLGGGGHACTLIAWPGHSQL